MKDKQFQQRYEKLNPEQKKAVDTIEGPVLVIAGPGSGKTELLSLRVANILQKTDTLPSSILCLTFTEAAATNMRKRLAQLIGRDAHRVAIHTFHSFGSEVISQNPEYFYNAAIYNPADQLVQIQILEDIFAKLSHSNPLSSYHPEQGYTYLRESLSRIDDLKKAGLSPAEFELILENDQQFVQAANPIITAAFEQRISAKTLDRFSQTLTELKAIPAKNSPVKNFKSAKETIIESLSEAMQQDGTKPITAWKKEFTKKDDKKNTVLKDATKTEKLLALADVYQQYQDRLHQLGYFDFSDMVLDTVSTIEANPDLMYNLQEQYQYLLVDEFQDTSGVQMRLLDNLLDAEVNEGRPNILAVGDDDQAIFKFQGANIDNILNFHKKYRDPAIVVLEKNYRSTQQILDFVREIILQGEERLENLLPEVTKNLISANSELQAGNIVEKVFTEPLHELIWIADQIKKSDANRNEIAIISRKHRNLEQVAKVLDYFNIPVAYERKRNLLELDHIKQIIKILSFINNTSQDHHLPTILSFPFWHLDRLDIWRISAKAHKSRKLWLELMLESEKLKPIAEFFIVLEQEAKQRTAEEIIDFITGARSLETRPSEQGTLFEQSAQAFTSPFKEYYSQKEDNSYLEFLHTLQAFLSAIREHKGNESIQLLELLEFIELLEKHRIPLSYKNPVSTKENAVKLLTAHGAKGLEFETVFVINCQESSWIGRSMPKLLSFSSNLPISAEKDSLEDKLRLFYVALTRAKRHLYLTHHLQAESGKDELKLRFLSASEKDPEEIETPETLTEARLEIIKHQAPLPEEKDLLRQQLQDYKLSVTHFNNFLNLVHYGPQKFLEHNILRFPQMMPAPAAYGSAVHHALHRLHTELKRTRKLADLDFFLDQFTQSLSRQRLNQNDYKKYLERGRDHLSAYYKAQAQELKPDDLSEYDFSNQGVVIGNAQLTGKIDRLSIDKEKHQVTVYDYKTGKALQDWQQLNSESKILKAWNYKNQLIFYKILVENARNFRNKYQVQSGVLEFVEAAESLKLDIDPQEFSQLQKLIQIVYNKIINLDFPDTTQYEASPFGIEHFTLDLLEGRI